MSATVWRRDRVYLLLPAAVFIAGVVALPVLRVVILSLNRDSLSGGVQARFAGLAQYIRLWRDSRWWLDLRNTAVFTLGSVALEMLAGTAFAFFLNRRFRGRGVATALVVLPWALPTAVMALAWAWIFNDSFGVANDLLQRLWLIRHPVAWLGGRASAMLAMIVADAWKTSPFVTLIVLAGLQGIPEEVMEAATVDGLSSWQRARRITLPLLAPSLAVALIFRLIQAWGAFDLVYVMTGGGPAGSTETVSLFAYRNYFRYLDFGYGAAAATQGVILVALLSGSITRLARSRY